MIVQHPHVREFINYVAEALEGAGYDKDKSASSALRFVSEVEQTAETVQGLTPFFRSLQSRLGELFSSIVDRPVRRVLVAPAPAYFEGAIECMISEFPDLVIADNYRVGELICGRPCISLAEALADPRGYDAYVLGTITSRFSGYFRDLLPPARTIGLWEMRLNSRELLECSANERSVKGLLGAIHIAKRPIVILSKFMDVTLISTYSALAEAGFDVIFATRHGKLDVSLSEGVPIEEFATLRHFHLTFCEMLEFLTANTTAPAIINYQRIFSSCCDLEKCLPLFSYVQALLRITASRSVVQLYDIYNVCFTGFECEARAMKLYHSMLEQASGILVNSDPFDTFRRYIDPRIKVVSLLRYPPRALARKQPTPGPFRIVVITGFLGEHGDPSRMTKLAILSLLRQGIHIHYYSNNPVALAFRDEAELAFPGLFHLEDPILNQAELIEEISQYDAGWFVVQMQVMAGLDRHYSSPFAKELASIFNASCCATAPLYYGAAGLPFFTYHDSYAARVAAEGTTFDIALTENGDLADGCLPLDQIDWKRARALAYQARSRFFMDQNIQPLADCLDAFIERSPAE
jgi:hypothetical protein